jgi:hypothetical protein
VEVLWDDAFGEHDEMTVDDMRNEQLVCTIGYLVRDDERGVYVAAEALGEGYFRSTTRIPRAMVREIRDLTRRRAARKARVPGPDAP